MKPPFPASLSVHGDLAVAAGIGFLMGWVFEQVGFSRPDTIRNFFRLKDMTVLRVLFSSLLTTMVLLHLFASLNWVHLPDLYASGTFVMPQALGGLLYGLALSCGGFCAGTAFVGLAAGCFEALTFIAGMVAGMLLFGEAFPSLESFINSTRLGKTTLSDYFHVPTPLLITVIIGAALLLFRASHWREKKLS